MRRIDEIKRDIVTQEALKMIVNDGFKGLSMQKLARVANVSPATLYIYFESREDLLNQLYHMVLNASNQAALKNFNSEAHFAEGLETLWLNRYHYFIYNPQHFLFLEQFINSPLIEKAKIFEETTYRREMKTFYKNAVSKNQVKELPIEIYWSVAFAPLYQLIKFKIQAGNHPANLNSIGPQKIKQCLQLVLQALTK